MVCTFPDRVAHTGGIVRYHVIVQWASTVGHTAGAQWTVAATTEAVTVMASPTIKEHEMCGGRGECDESTGICTCNEDTEYVCVFDQVCVMTAFLTCGWFDVKGVWHARH